jgi:hypothetical protein
MARRHHPTSTRCSAAWLLPALTGSCRRPSSPKSDGRLILRNPEGHLIDVFSKSKENQR